MNGFGLFLIRHENEWKLTVTSAIAKKLLSYNVVSSQLRENSSCTIKGFKEGDLKLTIKAEDKMLDLFYQTSDDVASKTKINCIEQL